MVVQFEYVFPTIRGVQAGREYYVSMCPLRLIPRMFTFDDEELPPEVRAQRTLNRSRVPEIARYVTGDPKGYVFSAITASIDADVSFESVGTEEAGRMGLLHIPMSARFIINDGQHRRAAIEMALREKPDIGDDSIAVVFFIDRGLERCQQMFADLNRHAVRPSKSLGVLYDYRDDMARLAKLVVLKSLSLRDIVEMEKTTLSVRSRKLFTLSAIYNATCCLVEGRQEELDELAALAIDFWEETIKQFPEWRHVIAGKMTSGEVRQDFIHSHGIVLQALGKAGSMLLEEGGKGWKKRIKALKKIDWSRKNAQLWEGRALIGGKVSKSGTNVTLTTNVVKQHLGIPLSKDEQKVEDAHLRGANGQA